MRCYVSAASIQEIVIKQGQQRLACSEPLLPLLDINQVLAPAGDTRSRAGTTFAAAAA